MGMSAMRLLDERNRLKKSLNMANKFVNIIHITLQLKKTEHLLRQKYMIY
jgi:hypothetical protein